jgi:hypothetical protein
MAKGVLDKEIISTQWKTFNMPENPTFFWTEDDIYMARQPGRKSVSLTCLRIRSRGKNTEEVGMIRVGAGIVFQPEHMGFAGPFPAVVSEIMV